MVARVLVWRVMTDDPGSWRRFRSFEAAERYARKLVAASASERHAISAAILGHGECATVQLDGVGRVWADIGAVSPL